MRRHGRTLTKIEVLCLAAEMEAIEAKATGRKLRWAEGAAASEKWWRKRGRSAGRQQAGAVAGAGTLEGGPVPRPRRAAQVPLRYRQSADLGGDDGKSQSSEQDDIVSETSADTSGTASED